MIRILQEGAVYKNGSLEPAKIADPIEVAAGRSKSMAGQILAKHNNSTEAGKLKLRFDALVSHDITYVGIVQTARASGMREFPMPYALTNCHNSLCAVGGTINEDDHVFGLSAAQKYGGDFVPAHQAVIHQYAREMMAGCGKMILGSDSHTRYGALGCMGVGEGGPELVKQLLGRYYEVDTPEVVAIYLSGTPKRGVGPQDVALALIKAVFKDGIVKNKIMEFMGPGVSGLSTEYRMGIDVMTTETTCLSSIWQTDDRTRRYLEVHGRGGDYAALTPAEGAYYDGVIYVDLDKVEPMIALPFHPSNVYTIKEFLENAEDLLAGVERETANYISNKNYKPDLRSKFKDGKFYTDQAVIAGCAGGSYENIAIAANLLRGGGAGNAGYSISVYPASQPIMLELMSNGYTRALLESGAVLRTAFCGPCFGAGDVPMNNGFSIRHSTRNFPNREGSQPATGQMSFVALMDARSIAATAVHGGVLTAATDMGGFLPDSVYSAEYTFDPEIYERKVYRGWGNPQPETELVFGPNIADWPAMGALPENILLKVASAIYDPVTTTDELIPSGETSSYRSNPLRLAEFTLSRKDPAYVAKSKAVQLLEAERKASGKGAELQSWLAAVLNCAKAQFGSGLELELNDFATSLAIGSAVFALKPGDGSAREQAASCQKVLGGWANIVAEYATKRYRSNLINWGILPLHCKDWEALQFKDGDSVYIPHIRQVISTGLGEFPALLMREDGSCQSIKLQMLPLTDDERLILLEGCLINFYSK